MRNESVLEAFDDTDIDAFNVVEVFKDYKCDINDLKRDTNLCL